VQGRVGNTLEHIGIGKNFLNRTLMAQHLRESVSVQQNWKASLYNKTKKFLCTTKEMVTTQKRKPTE
jgi:hypothetical protein